MKEPPEGGTTNGSGTANGGGTTNKDAARHGALFGAIDALWGAALVGAFGVGLLSYGGVTERALAMQAACVLAAALLAAARLVTAVAVGRRPLHLPHLPRVAALGAVAYVAWCSAQLLPLPPAMLASLSPEASAWQERFATGGVASATLSLDTPATRRALADLAVFLSAAATFALWAARPRRRDLLVAFLVILGVVGFVVGVWRLATADPTLRRHFAGPLVNRNHFAGMMLMLAPVAAGWASTLLARAQRASDRRAHLLTVAEALSSPLVLAILTPVLFLGATLTTLSRSGAASAAVAMMAWFAFVVRGRATRLAASGAAVVMLATTVLVLSLGLEPIARRFTQLGRELDPTLAGTRAQIWRDTARIVDDFPVTGSGLGSYYGVYLAYASMPTTTHPIHAHNEWLQTAAETGYVGAALLAATTLGLLAFGVRRCRAMGDAPEQPVFAGLLAAVLGIALQSFGEFSLRIPLNWLILAALVGLLCGSGATASRGARHGE